MATRSTKRPRRSQARDRQARPSSESLCDQRTNTRGIGVTDRSANLLGPLEHDQRALLLNTKTFQRVLGRVEIDLVDHEVRRFLLDLFDDRALLPAGWTPGGSYIDEDRFAGCLGLFEGLVVQRLRSVACD